MQAVHIISALAQPTRLKAFVQLSRALPHGLSAGELARLIGTPANTMSVHLAILARAGLISSERAGRNTVFKAKPQAISDLALFLMTGCREGQARDPTN